jgi:hypothetical protein
MNTQGSGKWRKQKSRTIIWIKTLLDLVWKDNSFVITERHINLRNIHAKDSHLKCCSRSHANIICISLRMVLQLVLGRCSFHQHSSCSHFSNIHLTSETNKNWNCFLTLPILFIALCFLSRYVGHCFSTAGERPGTGPWHQLYRATRGFPGICHFSFLSNFYE